MTTRNDGRLAFHGELSLSVLLALYDGPGYGMELVRRIEDRTDLRFGRRKVWPILRRLLDQGAVTKRQIEVPLDGPHGCIQRRVATEWKLTPVGMSKVERALGRIAAVLGGDELHVCRGRGKRMVFVSSAGTRHK